MNTLRRPTRMIVRALAAGLAVSLLAGGCGVLGSDPAATVNGADIDDDELQDELVAIRDNERYRQGLEAGFGTSLVGASEGAFDAFFAARVLTLRIYYELAEQYLAEQGVEVGPSERDSVRDSVIQQVGGQQVFETFPEEYRDLLVHRAALITAVDEALGAEFRAPGAAADYFEENAEQFEQRCLSHILVETEEEAERLAQRIEGGADFAEVAEEFSTDPGSASQGGELGCQTRGTFVPEFEEAAFALEEGEVSEPVETPFGFHLILLREVRVPSFDEVRAEVEQRLAQLAQEAFNEWLVEATSEADVDVSPHYGEWVVGARPGSSVGEVVPPEGPTTTTPAGAGGPSGDAPGGAGG